MQTLIRRCLKFGQRISIFLIEDVPLSVYLAAFGFLVIVWACIYFSLTPSQNGLALGSQVMPKVTFWGSLYFSIVTVSSLGYGDIYPIGISRLFACMEVIFGLGIAGIVLAKVTSRRLSYHVRRLFSSDAKKRIEEFTLTFESLEEDLKQSMTALGEAYQVVPGRAGASHDDTLRAQSSFQEAINTLCAHTVGLHDYVSYETEQGGYFSIIPMDALLQLGNSIDKNIFILSQLIISLSPKTRENLFDSSIRQQISKTLNKQQAICQFVQRHCRDGVVKNCFLQICETCGRVSESYFATPVTFAAIGQPDQLSTRTDEPQIPSASPQNET